MRSVFFTSLLLISIQFLLVKLAVYTQGWISGIIAISYALLGMSVGAFIAIFRNKQLPSIWITLSFLVSSFCILWTHHLYLSSFFFFFPFLFLGHRLTLFYDGDHPISVYLFDLMGCAVGITFMILGISFLSLEKMIIISFLSSFFLIFKKKLQLLCPMILILVTIVFPSQSIINIGHLTFCSDKSAPMKVFCFPEASFFYSHDSLNGRVDVLDFSPHLLSVYFDGISGDGIYQDSPKLYKNDPRIIAGLFPNHPKVLVIGAAAEGVIKPLKLITSPSQILAYELNPGIIDLMENKAYRFSHEAYKDISLQKKAFYLNALENNERFDLITLLNTHSTPYSNGLGGPDYLHTIELAQYLYDHLNPNGFLVIEEVIQSGVFPTVVSTFEQVTGEKSIFTYDWYSLRPDFKESNGLHYQMMYLKKGTLNTSDKKAIHLWFSEPSQSSFMKIFRFQVGNVLFQTKKDPVPPVNYNRPYLLSPERFYHEFTNKTSFCFGVLFFSIIAFFFIRTKSRIPSSNLYLFEGILLGFIFFFIQVTFANEQRIPLVNPLMNFLLVNAVTLIASGIGAFFANKFFLTRRSSFLILILCVSIMSLISNQWMSYLLFLCISFVMGVPFRYLLLDCKKVGYSLPLLVCMSFLGGAVGNLIGQLINGTWGFTNSYLVVLTFYFFLFFNYHFGFHRLIPKAQEKPIV